MRVRRASERAKSLGDAKLHKQKGERVLSRERALVALSKLRKRARCEEERERGKGYFIISLRGFDEVSSLRYN